MSFTMIPIMNNVGRLLGHIDRETYVNTHDHITVQEDRPLVPFDPDAPVTEDMMTVNICHITKKRIRFRNEWDESKVTYLVIDSKLPDWFWQNKGCLEFEPDHFERIPW